MRRVLLAPTAGSAPRFWVVHSHHTASRQHAADPVGDHDAAIAGTPVRKHHLPARAGVPAKAATVVVKLAGIDRATFSEVESPRLPLEVPGLDNQSLGGTHRGIAAHILVIHLDPAIADQQDAYAGSDIHPAIAGAPSRPHHLPTRTRHDAVGELGDGR